MTGREGSRLSAEVAATRKTGGGDSEFGNVSSLKFEMGGKPF